MLKLVNSVSKTDQDHHYYYKRRVLDEFTRRAGLPWPSAPSGKVIVKKGLNCTFSSFLHFKIPKNRSKILFLISKLVDRPGKDIHRFMFVHVKSHFNIFDKRRMR
jgi:hypothetical protein